MQVPSQAARGSATHIQQLCGEAWIGPGLGQRPSPWCRPQAPAWLLMASSHSAHACVVSSHARVSTSWVLPECPEHALACGLWPLRGTHSSSCSSSVGRLSPSLPMTQPGSGHTPAPPFPHPCRDLPWGQCHRRAPHPESSAGRCQVPMNPARPQEQASASCPGVWEEGFIASPGQRDI